GLSSPNAGARAAGDRPTPNAGLLVWTTTPWTLTSNVAVAVGPEVEYVAIRQEGQVSWVAREALPRAVRGEYEIVETRRGSEMVGWRYDGPFDELEAARDWLWRRAT